MQTRPNCVEVYVVDEHGCALNTEPICVVDTEYHEWFLDWLNVQPCEYSDLPLLWHPVLGETLESYLDKKEKEEASDEPDAKL